MRLGGCCMQNLDIRLAVVVCKDGATNRGINHKNPEEQINFRRQSQRAAKVLWFCIYQTNEIAISLLSVDFTLMPCHCPR